MRKTFTLEEANNALVFVTAILTDIQKSLAELQKLKRSKDEPSEAEIQKILKRVSHFIGELTQLGCVMEDVERGIVDFPSYRNGEFILLCFRLGEESIEFWHPINGSYENRNAIEEEFSLSSL